MAEVGRPRKYGSAAALRKAVERYFRSISYERDVIIKRREIGTDKDGKPAVVETPEKLLDDKGRPVREIVWLEEPSKSALCLYLGISRDTWASYARDPDMRAVAESVDARLLARLEEQLSTRNSVQGVIFNLKANYGWTDRVEITHKEVGVEEYLAQREAEGAGHGY